MLDNMPRGTICIEDLEMGKIRDAKRVLRDRALRIAEAEGLLDEDDVDESYASANAGGDTSES